MMEIDRQKDGQTDRIIKRQTDRKKEQNVGQTDRMTDR